MGDCKELFARVAEDCREEDSLVIVILLSGILDAITELSAKIVLVTAPSSISEVVIGLREKSLAVSGTIFTKE